MGFFLMDCLFLPLLWLAPFFLLFVVGFCKVDLPRSTTLVVVLNLLFYLRSVLISALLNIVECVLMTGALTSGVLARLFGVPDRLMDLSSFFSSASVEANLWI